MKELLSGIRKFCVFLFWPRRTYKRGMIEINRKLKQERIGFVSPAR